MSLLPLAARPRVATLLAASVQTTGRPNQTVQVRHDYAEDLRACRRFPARESVKRCRAVVTAKVNDLYLALSRAKDLPAARLTAGSTISDRPIELRAYECGSVFDQLAGRYMAGVLSFSPFLRNRPCTHPCHPRINRSIINSCLSQRLGRTIAWRGCEKAGPHR